MTKGKLYRDAAVVFFFLILSGVLVNFEEYALAVAAFGSSMIFAMILTAECLVEEIKALGGRYVDAHDSEL